MANTLPKDVYDSLVASGVKFDEQGNIIDDDFFDNLDPVDTDEDEQEEVRNQQPDPVEETDDQDEDDEDEDEDEDESEQDDKSEQEDENPDDADEEPEQKKSLEKKPAKKPADADKSEEKPFKLTPKATAKPVEDKQVDNAEIIRLREELLALKEALVSQGKPQAQKPSVVAEDDEFDDEDLTDEQRNFIKELKKERAEFHKVRMRQLSSMLENEVNRKFKDNNLSFAEITTSQEWADYLGTMRYGSRIGDFYVNAIKSGEISEMISFFDEFKERYIPKKEVKSQSANQKKLSDLAVPDNTKAKKRLKTPSKYDFEEKDFSEKLEQFQRGRISAEQFAEFERKYEAAEIAGRVRPTQ